MKFSGDFPTKGFRPWTLDQVSILRERVGLELPEQFARFLRANGSGATFTRIVPGVNGMVSGIYDLEGLLDSLSDPYIWIPHNYLGFGYGDGGRLCVEIGAPDKSRVSWADFDYAEELGLDEGHRSMEIMRPLFEDFGGFVRSFESWQIV